MLSKLLNPHEPHLCIYKMETELTDTWDLHWGLNKIDYVKTMAHCMSSIHYFLHSWFPHRNTEVRGNWTSSQLSKCLCSWGHWHTEFQVQFSIYLSSITKRLTRLLAPISCSYCFILHETRNPFISTSVFIVGWRWGLQQRECLKQFEEQQNGKREIPCWVSFSKQLYKGRHLRMKAQIWSLFLII